MKSNFQQLFTFEDKNIVKIKLVNKGPVPHRYFEI
jgi:hypothetical protein